MKEEEVKTLVWQIARESAAKGIGWAQEGVVMRAVRDRLKAGQVDNQDVHHMVLNAWHDLFADKRLAWGYNLDNPNAPFFHTR